jgi:hypothetical protein
VSSARRLVNISGTAREIDLKLSQVKDIDARFKALRKVRRAIKIK